MILEPLYDRIDLFIDELWQKVRRHERTLDSFFTSRNALGQLHAFAKKHGFPEPMPGFIRSFKEHLIGRGLKPASVNAYLVAARVFFENCFERGLISINPAKLVKGVDRKSVV